MRVPLLPILLAAALAAPFAARAVSEYDLGEGADEAEAEGAVRSAVGPLIGRMMPEVHVQHRAFDASMAPLAWTNFIDSLDYPRLYFTQEDLAEFEDARLNYHKIVASGDTSFAKKVFDRYLQRVREYNAFIAPAVSNDYDFAEDETYVWRRKDATRPADKAAQEALWLQCVKNSLLIARISCELNTQTNAAATDEPLTPEAVFQDDFENVPRMEKAMADAREDYLRASRRMLDVLESSDQEYWTSRFYDAVPAAYDPHSNYLSPIAAEDFAIDMGLSLQGIGATLQTEDGACKIVEIIPGSPAERDDSPEHLVPGDKIIAVAQGDGEFTDVRHWALSKAVRLIRGPKGSTVRLRVIPTADPGTTKIVTLVRDEIKLEEQAASSEIESFTDEHGQTRRFGYVKLPSFYATMGRRGDDARTCSQDVAKLLDELNEDEVEGLVLDLRGNGGGSLPEAVRMAGLFLRTGPIVVVKESRRGIALPDNDPSVHFRKPLVVLVDRLSASASEIVAAALQDYGRAVIAGDFRTHGKGTVQTVIPLQNDRLGELKATTAQFYRVNGASTQLRGVECDIHLPSIFEAYAELGEDKLPRALPWTHIAPAAYKPVDSLREVLPSLRQRSKDRMATNEVWAARLRLIDHFAAFNTNKTVSLRYEDRRREMEADEKLNREIARVSTGDTDETLLDAATDTTGTRAEKNKSENETPSERRRRLKEQRRRNDIVLDEALRILADLVDRHGSPSGLDGKDASFDLFENFFR